jgi:hypothetical protein
MKIKCYRFECSRCGEISSIQVFYRKDGSVGYARARHKNAQGFFYHKQTIDYINEKLRVLNQTMRNIDHDQIMQKPIDQNNLDSSSKTVKAGPMGFEPMTFSLEG